MNNTQDNISSSHDNYDERTYNESDISEAPSHNHHSERKSKSYKRLYLNHSMLTFDYFIIVDFSYTPSNVYSFQYTIMNINNHIIEKQLILLANDTQQSFYDKITQINQMLKNSIESLKSDRILVISPQSVNILLLDLPDKVRIFDYQTNAISKGVPIHSFGLFRRYFMERQLLLDYNFTIMSLFIDIVKYFINGNIKFTTISPKTVALFGEKENGKQTFFREYIFTTIGIPDEIKNLILSYRRQLLLNKTTITTTTNIPDTDNIEKSIENNSELSSALSGIDVLDKKHRITFLRKLKKTLQKRQSLINSNNKKNEIDEITENETDNNKLTEKEIINDNINNNNNNNDDSNIGQLKENQMEIVKQLNKFIKSEQKSIANSRNNNSDNNINTNNNTITGNSNNSYNNTNSNISNTINSDNNKIEKLYEHISQQNEFNQSILGQVQVMVDQSIKNQQFFLNEINGINKKIEKMTTLFDVFYNNNDNNNNNNNNNKTTTATTATPIPRPSIPTLPIPNSEKSISNNKTTSTAIPNTSPLALFEIQENKKELIEKQQRLNSYKNELESQLKQMETNNNNNDQIQQNTLQQQLQNLLSKQQPQPPQPQPNKLKYVTRTGNIGLLDKSRRNTSTTTIFKMDNNITSYQPRPRIPILKKKYIPHQKKQYNSTFSKSNHSRPNINNISSLPVKNTIMSSFANFIKSFKK